MRPSVIASASRLALSTLAIASVCAAAEGCSAASDADGATASSAEAVTGASSNDETAFDYLVSQGLTFQQAAGVVGNLDQESGMDPTISQIGGGPGRGIAQWSVGGRWDTETDDNVVWYASKKGQSPWSLSLQLEFIWYELTTFSGYGFSSLRAATNVTNATVAFQDDYEGCGECDQTNRIDYAQSAFNAYGKSVIGLDSKCLDVLGDSNKSGARVDLYECNAGDNQQWTLDGDNLKVFGNKCLDVVNGGTANGTPVQIWECNGDANQVWDLASDGLLKNPHSGKCLNVPGFDSANGTELIIWDCETKDNGNEVWIIN